MSPNSDPTKQAQEIIFSNKIKNLLYTPFNTIDLQNFLTFSFNSFITLVQNFTFVPTASPKLLNLNQDHLSKKAVFLVKSL